jgi:hypothetical protein
MCINKNFVFNQKMLYEKNLLSKKLLNNIFYHKSYIRSNLLANKKLKIVDHYSSSSSIDSDSFKNRIPAHFFDCNGVSINSKMYTFTNLLNSSIKFNTPMYSFVGTNLNYIEPFDKILSSLNQEDNNFREILILNPIKGGFQCYFSGVFGFLPRSQANILFYNLASNFLHALKNASQLTGLNLFRNILDLQKRFIFRFPLKQGKVSLYPEHFKNNFSNKKTIKKRVFHNSLNVVFLAHIDIVEK